MVPSEKGHGYEEVEKTDVLFTFPEEMNRGWFRATEESWQDGAL